MSSFADAITASLVASMDPMQTVVRTMAQQQAQVSGLQLDGAKVELVKNLEGLINAGIANGSDPAVLNAYRKMLDKYTS